jgi:hypothetical protein
VRQSFEHGGKVRRLDRLEPIFAGGEAQHDPSDLVLSLGRQLADGPNSVIKKLGHALRSGVSRNEWKASIPLVSAVPSLADDAGGEARLLGSIGMRPSPSSCAVALRDLADYAKHRTPRERQGPPAWRSTGKR